MVRLLSQGLTWWKHSVWLRELTLLWRAWQSSLLSSTPSPHTRCTETSSWHKAPSEIISAFNSAFACVYELISTITCTCLNKYLHCHIVESVWVHSGLHMHSHTHSYTDANCSSGVMHLSLSPHRFIHPAGFSPEHTISIAFRVLQDTPREPFALWQLTDIDFQPKMGVVLDRE